MVYIKLSGKVGNKFTAERNHNVRVKLKGTTNVRVKFKGNTNVRVKLKGTQM